MFKLILPIKLALKSLRRNLGRTALSLTGTVIGVASVVLVLSLGMGVKQYLVDQVSTFGTDIMQIEIKVPKVSKTSSQNAGGQVGGTKITTFKLGDAQEVAKLSNVGDWYAAIMSQQVASYQGKNKQSFIMGVTAGVLKADPQTEVEFGEMFTQDDDDGLRQVVVIGSEVKNVFFGEQEAVGKNIKIKGQSYEVLGVLKERGTAAFFSFDDTMYMPLKTAQKKVAGINHIQFAVFKIYDMSRLDLTIAEATDLMRDQHNIDDPDDDDFAVNSIVELMEILNTVFKYVNMLLLALASISLIVGGVGIMNVMYVSVTERTFEIGLKKSIGAKNGNILAQFLSEAVFITMSGGIFGLVAGYGLSKVAELVAAKFNFALTFSVSWWAAAIGFGFSALIGIVFGFFPARKASQLTPMDALRKE